MKYESLILHSISIIYLALLVSATLSNPVPLGADIHFHLDIAQVYAKGQNGMFSQTVFNVIGFPYPPIFHLILVPSVPLNLQYQWTRILQVALGFGCYLSVIALMKTYGDNKTAILTATALLGSFAFTDATIQARPQTLDMLILPWAIHFFMSNKNRLFSLSAIVLAWNHGVAALSGVWTLLLSKLKKNFKITLATILAVSPIVLLTLVYFGGAMSTWSGHTDTYQETLLFANPAYMIPVYCGASLVGWLFVFRNLKNWGEQPKLNRALVLSVLGLTVLIPFWADRFLQYAAIPLCCLVGLELRKDRRLLVVFVPLIILAFSLNIANLWWITATGNWWTK
jgi:uncharacterized membrane protein